MVLTSTQIDALLHARLQEAAAVMHMDQSHSAIRQALQQHLAATHRAANPNSDYYNYPLVHDVYGDADSGQVVHSDKGELTMSKYAKDGKGYKLNDHKSVKPAYVTVEKDKQKESMVYVDGQETTLAAKESDTGEFCEEVVDLREACFDAKGVGMIKLIAPGHGSTGYYSAEVLKEATTKGVFDNAQMFIDHATEEEEASRPEGSVHNLAAKGGKATFREDGPEGAGVYTQAKAYPDVAAFLNSRSKDIGVSIRATGKAVAGQVAGKVNRIVKSLDNLRSADFVTKAGAGGKLVSLLESFREAHPEITRPPAAKEKKDMEIDEKEYKDLKEAAGKVPGLQLRIDRGDERLNRMEGRDHAAAYLKESGLPVAAQARLLKMVTSNQYTVPVKDGVLDPTAFTEALKLLVTEEAAYLKESGAGLRLVNNLGDVAAPTSTEDETKFAEAQLKVDGEFDSLIGSLSGVPRKKEKGAA